MIFFNWKLVFLLYLFVRVSIDCFCAMVDLISCVLWNVQLKYQLIKKSTECYLTKGLLKHFCVKVLLQNNY